MTKLFKISRHTPSVLQGAFDFTGGKTISMTMEHRAEPVLFRVFTIAIAALVCVYLYEVSASVLNVIARKESLTRIEQLQTSISVMEQQYFQLSQQLTPQMGASLGLTALQETSYVYSPGNTAMADTIVGNEI